MNKLPIICLASLLLLFTLGIVHLFHLRFAQGDLYPEYSSLRSDPLGTKALYQSLQPFLHTRRLLSPLIQLGPGRGRTLLCLGSSPRDLAFSRAELAELTSFVAGGGRLVVALSSRPPVLQPLRRFQSTAPAPSPSPDSQDPSTPSSQTGPVAQTLSLSRAWKFQIRDRAPPGPEAVAPHSTVAFRARTAESPKLPETIVARGNLFFEEYEPDWRVLYSREPDLPVVLEQRLGQGTIVLLADSYLFSNEALLLDREAALLAWLVGSAGEVLFEESHLGVVDQPGLASLLRKYNLYGVGWVLLILSILFVWKNATSFLPPAPETARPLAPETVHGKESGAGFVNLLRRNIPRTELFKVCLAEWARTCQPETSPAQREIVQAWLNSHDSLSPRDRNPVQLYRQLSTLLTRRR